MPFNFKGYEKFNTIVLCTRLFLMLLICVDNQSIFFFKFILKKNVLSVKQQVNIATYEYKDIVMARYRLSDLIYIFIFIF